MCTIFGWNHKLSPDKVDYILCQAQQRGRDGWGLYIDGKEFRSLGSVIPISIRRKLYQAKKVLGNFRATPTTEEESTQDNLQPYQGVVHNGTIANDKMFGSFEIDSMVLGGLFSGVTNLTNFGSSLKRIKGSYALAFFKGKKLFLAANYKPIYWWFNNDGSNLVFASEEYMLPYDIVKQFPPYHFCEVFEGIHLKEMFRRQTKRVALACSSGLDSSTVAYHLKSQGYRVTLVYFKYGCLAEKKEFNRVQRIAQHGGFDLEILEMPRKVMRGTIVEGKYYKRKKGMGGAEYAYDWVSARNLLMLSILTAYAETNNIGYIAFGGNLEESGAYPDNEEEFGLQFNRILPFAVQNGVKIELLQPLARFMKHEIVKIGQSLRVPWEMTWSCYGNGKKPCGVCGPCFMRRKAFERNGIKDPVIG